MTSDFDVSKEKPSLLLDDMLRLKVDRGTGSETERGDRSIGVSLLSSLGRGFDIALGGSTGLETIRWVGRANGPDPSDEGYEGLRFTGFSAVDSSPVCLARLDENPYDFKPFVGLVLGPRRVVGRADIEGAERLSVEGPAATGGFRGFDEA